MGNQKPPTGRTTMCKTKKSRVSAAGAGELYGAGVLGAEMGA